MLKEEVAMAMGARAAMMERFNGTPAGQTGFERATPGIPGSGLEQGGRVTIMVGCGRRVEVMRVPGEFLFHLIFSGITR